MSPSDAETVIMARLRGVTERSPATKIRAEHASLRPTGKPVPEPHSSRIERFRKNLEKNGATSAEARDRTSAVREIARYVASRHVQRRIVTGHDPRLAALPWRDGGLLPRFGAATGGEGVAVSYAHDGIAESGSVVLWLDRNNPARNNLLPEDQVVLVDRESIHEDLEDLWKHPEHEAGGRGPRGLMMVSGPSSTADIAMQLVKGAHGPRALHIVIVGEPAAADGVTDASVTS